MTKHLPANHRGDDINTIGTFPCECAKDLEDKPPLTLLDAMLFALEEIFDEAARKREESGKETVDQAHKEFFKND